MSKQFVKIVNRGSYTNVQRAQFFLDRRMAEVLRACESTGRVLEIRMLDASEMELLRASMRYSARVENTDDGIQRRYVNRISGQAAPSVYATGGKLIDRCIATSPAGISVKQLLPIERVGTGHHVTGQADVLTRRQHRPDKGRSVWVQPTA